MNRKCYSCTVATRLRFTGVYYLCPCQGGSESPGVLRSLLGWKLMGTSLLRNWLDLINPLQMGCGGALAVTAGFTCPAHSRLEFLQSFQPWWSCQQSRESPAGLHPPLLSSASPPVLCKDSLKAVILFPAASPCWFGHFRVAGKAVYLGPGALHALPNLLRAAGAAVLGGIVQGRDLSTPGCASL